MRLTGPTITFFCVTAWLCVSTAFAAACPGISANKQPRLLIPLFQYKGAEQGEAKNQFSLYQGVISVKLTALIGETQAPAKQLDESTDAIEMTVQTPVYLEKLRVHLPSGLPISDNLTFLGDRQDYWDKTLSLELLRGLLWSGKPYYFVDSEIHIGELRGRFPRSDVRVRLTLEPEKVPSTNDTHSVVTYYALAMDARRLDCDPAVVNHFLSRTLSILKDLKGREAGGLAPDLVDLETVIIDELQGARRAKAKQ